MKRGVMKHGSRRSAPLLTVARHHPPPFRLIFPNTTAASSSSSHRPRAHAHLALHASRLTPQQSTVRLTLSPRSPPTAPASATSAPPSVGSRSTPSHLCPPSDGRPSLSTLLSSAPPYLTRPLPLVHHSFHFLLLALPLTFLCPRVRPGCRTRCTSPRPRCTSNTPV